MPLTTAKTDLIYELPKEGTSARFLQKQRERQSLMLCDQVPRASINVIDYVDATYLLYGSAVSWRSDLRVSRHDFPRDRRMHRNEYAAWRMGDYIRQPIVGGVGFAAP